MLQFPSIYLYKKLQKIFQASFLNRLFGVILIFSCFSCQKHKKSVQDDIISLTIQDPEGSPVNQIPADGLSLAYIEAIIPNSMEPKNITLYTDNGSFKNGAKVIELTSFRVKENKRFVSSGIIAPVIPGKANIYGKVDNFYSKEIVIDFTKALASALHIHADTVTLQRVIDRYLEITVTAFSEKGYASTGEEIGFDYFLNDNPTGDVIEVIPTNKTGAGGKLKFRINAINLNEAGILRVEAYLISNPQIRDSLIIYIK